jgi:DNA-binding transcriptional MerR regulator
MPMYTVGQLARRAALSRSTLLYYDSIGLLCPTERSNSNYRLYSENDLRRLERICRYREAGLGLAEIRQVLDGASAGAAAILEGRLVALNSEICVLREQQRVVVRLLRNRAKLGGIRAMDKERWVALLRNTGLTDDEMRRWHVEFERMAPEGHQDFLESLGVSTDEIGEIRRWSRSEAD